MSSSRTRGSRPLKGSSNKINCGLKARIDASAAFMSMPRERFFQFAVKRQFQLLDQRGRVPGWVKTLQVVEELADCHPVRQLLIFAGIADALEVGTGECGGLLVEDRCGAGRRVDHVHQQLDERRFTRAIVAYEREHRSTGHGQSKRVQGLGFVVALG